MSTMEYRTLHVYRLPIYQKRTMGIDNHISSPNARSPSPNRPVRGFRRRHSTPPAFVKHIIDTHSPPSNTFMKYYYPPTRPLCKNKEQNPLSSDSIKSPPRPTSLVKLRRQEERGVRMVTTPTSITSVPDIVLPVAKKNRNTIVETPCSVVSETQSMNRNTLTAKRRKRFSLDLEQGVSFSDDDSHEKSSSRDDNSKLKLIKWCREKCPCRLPHCNICHWYCSCPFCCWIICILSALAIFIGIIISIRFLSN